MTASEFYLIKGYIHLLVYSTPNGRYVHQVRNKVQALELHIVLDLPITKDYEEQVKDLIHNLYPNDNYTPG